MYVVVVVGLLCGGWCCVVVGVVVVVVVVVWWWWLWWLWCGREIDNDVSVDIESKKTAQHSTGALDDQQLLAIEGSKKSRQGVQLDGVRKMPQITAKPPLPTTITAIRGSYRQGR